MGRVKEFDEAAALDAAMHLFWRQGYEATSMNDLVTATGVARAGLYTSFGSKHELYCRALEAYVASRDPALVARLAGPGPALPAIAALLEEYASQSQQSCFVVNAAVERLPGDAQVALSVEASWETLEVALLSALSRARASGELAATADPASLARFLLAVLQGIRVLAKGRLGSGRGRDAVREAMSLLTFKTDRSEMGDA